MKYGEVLNIIKPGNTVHMEYEQDYNPNNGECVILAIVDETKVVYRKRNMKRSGSWYYHVDDMYFFKLLIESGILKV